LGRAGDGGGSGRAGGAGAGGIAAAGGAAGALPGAGPGGRPGVRDPHRAGPPRGRSGGDGAPAAFAGRGDHRPDRKSTRLNSSHVKISYAVFCLKKKKNKSSTEQEI